MYKSSLSVPKFCDFEREKDAECLELIFKHDYVNLISISRGYNEGDGVEKFTTFADNTLINERKIMRVGDKSVAFLIFFVLEQKNQKCKKSYDGDMALVLMGVHPNERRQGNGSKVMHYFMKRSKELGSEKVWLSVKKDNIAALGLYKKFGFFNTNDNSFSANSHWWSAYIFNGEINKRALYDNLLEQKFCDITIKYNK